MISLFQRNNLLIFRTGVSCFSLTLFYFFLFAFTDRQKDRQRVEYTHYAWAGETFFQLCCCASFLFWREIGFGFTYYLCTQSTIQLWCCVGFFGSGGKQFLVLLTYLVYNTVVRLCQCFCCGRKANLVRIFLLNPNFLLVHRNKLSVTVYLFLALYGSTTIQS